MPRYNPTDPKQRNWMQGGVALLVAIVPFRIYVMAPMQLENGLVVQHVEGLEGQNRRASVQAARGGGELEERNLVYERHVAKLEELIPAAEEVASLMNDVSGAARQARVELLRMVPEPSETGAFYDKTAYDMAVIGEYHNVARFLTNVASLSRIVTPVELDVQIYDQPLRFPEMVSAVIVTFRIETYVLPDQTAAPPPAALPGG